ncbi:MAG: SOS response-associated peptidase [Planctomycetia bacterium]|nr:SOS response-associated peptidase [Planctomycetia bacterium]
MLVTMQENSRSRVPSSRRISKLSGRWKTIITTEANPMMAGLHDRMPVILAPDARALWLDPDFTGKEKVLSLLQPYPDDDLVATPVSRLVNSPKSDDPRCLNPL